MAKKSGKSAAKKSPAKKAAKASKSKPKVAKRNVTKGGKATKPSKVAAKATSRSSSRAKGAKVRHAVVAKAPAKAAKALAGRGSVKMVKSSTSTKSPKKAMHKSVRRPAGPMSQKTEQDIRAGLSGAEQSSQSGVTLSQTKLATPEKSAEFAVEVARMLRDDKCEDVVCLDVRGRSPVTDYLVIGSGTSDRQMRSVLQHVEDYGAKTGDQCVRRSIDERATWILADFVDVVVHLFEPNTRAHYDLEMLWGDSKRVAWERPDQVSRDYAGLNN